MLHYVLLFLEVWFGIGFLSIMGWQLAAFKLRFVTIQLAYYFGSTVGFTVLGTLLGPLAFFYGAYGYALHTSD
jgi:hypothetical protein